MFNTVFAQTTENGGLVNCAIGAANTPCTIADIFVTLNNFVAFLLYTIFPFAFFFAIMYAFIPILKDPSNAGNIEHMKKSLIKITIGTLFVVGAFFFVRFIISSIGLKNSAVNSSFDQNTDTINSSQSSLLFDYAYAENTESADSSVFIKDPLENATVKTVLSGLINFMYFFVVLAIAYGYLRGAFLLVTSQQNPGNIVKGKLWVLWTTIVAVVLFAAPLILGIITDTVDSLKSDNKKPVIEVGCIDSSVVGGCQGIAPIRK